MALLVRVIYNDTVAHSYYPLHDSLAYQTIGLNILKEHCFCWQPNIPTVYRPPLWPAIIAVISLIMGPNDYYARLFLSCVGSGTCVLIYLFAKDLFGLRIGMVAGAFAAVYPELYIYDGWLYTESLYIFLLLAFCYSVYLFQRRPKTSRWIWCGVLLGLLSLTRPNGLLVLGLFLIWVAIMCRTRVLTWRDTVPRSIAISLLALAIIAPWTIRNYNVSHSFVPVATGDGTVLLGAYNDMILTTTPHLGSWINPLLSAPDVTKPYPVSTCLATCEVARESAYEKAAEVWIQGHISSLPYLLTLHFLNMWQPDTHEADLPTDRFPQLASSREVLSMMKTFPILLFLLAALGFWVLLGRWREFLLIYLVIAMTIGECLVFYGSARFRAPIEPLLILLGAGALWWLTRKEKGPLWRIARVVLQKSERNARNTT